MESAQFSPDGENLITCNRSEGTARLWYTPTFPLPIPRWLPQLAEAAAGQRLDDRGFIEIVSGTKFLRIRQEVAESKSGDRLTQWAKWFCADRATRTISPFSSNALSEYVQRRIQENTLDSLREAVLLSPTNGLAFALLARKLLPGDPSGNPREAAEAQWLSQRAVQQATL